MRALIVGAAPAVGGDEHYSTLLAEADVVVAADGGAALALALGRVPDVAVGDFDSASPETLDALIRRGVPIQRHPSTKDESDLDLALHVARSLRADSVTLTAAFSGRLDHTLASLGTLMRAEDMLADVQEADFAAWLVGGARPRLALSGAPGSILSVIAPQGASGVILAGLEYDLEGDLPPLSSLGLSNRMVSSEAEVAVRQGIAIVLAPGDPSRAGTPHVTAP